MNSLFYNTIESHQVVAFAGGRGTLVTHLQNFVEKVNALACHYFC